MQSLEHSIVPAEDKTDVQLNSSGNNDPATLNHCSDDPNIIEVKSENICEEIIEIKSENDVSSIDSKMPVSNKLDGITILIRSNRNNELMVSITGKNICPEIIDQLKLLFEVGEGKDCNVKSLFCKSITR